MRRWRRVVAVTAAYSMSIAVIITLINRDVAVAVIVDAIAQFQSPYMNGGVTILSVACTQPQAVAISISLVCRDAIDTVIVDTIT